MRFMKVQVLAVALMVPAVITLGCSGGVEVGDVEEIGGGDSLKGAGTKEDPYVLTCSTKARDVPGLKDGKAHVNCPSGCTSGSLYGTCSYTFDSAVCVAANHSGALKGKPYPGGKTVAMHAAGIKGGDGYVGSKQGDISSSSWSTYDDSLTFKGMTAGDCADSAGGGGKKKKKPGR